MPKPTRDHDELHPMRESSIWIVLIIVSLLLIAGALWWRWSQRPAPAVQPAAVEVAQPTPETGPAQPEETTPEHPIETPPDEASLPPLANSDVQITDAIRGILSRKAISMLSLDNIVRHVVVTVDNLPNERASALHWPIRTTPGRFTVEGPADQQTIAASNSARYTSFVQLVESVDTGKMVALYKHFYPLFQTAYRDLGHPNGYFNDRLVAVIDDLLQAPEPQGPLHVILPPINSGVDVPITRPWVRYEFEDSKLESLSAGQKIMLRVGPSNERRLKAKLTALRAQIASIKQADNQN